MLLVNVHVLYCFIQESSVQVKAINFKVQKVKQWEKSHGETHFAEKYTDALRQY